MRVMKDAYEEIIRLLDGRVRRDVPLAPYTTWRVGGPADLLAEPATYEETLMLVTLLQEAGTPYTVVGGGSNLLVPDAGYRGTVIRLHRAAGHVAVDGTRVTAGGGVRMPRLLQEAVVRGLSGLERLCGIPGTVGGAVYGNAGVPGVETGDLLESVTFITRCGERTRVAAADIGFGYRSSGAAQYGMVWEAVYRLVPDSRERLVAAVRDGMRHRMAVQPLGRHTAGSVFRNPAGHTAGKLLDDSGCKGLHRGGAAVSELHANFIVNTGSATAADIRGLMDDMAARVREQTGVMLEPEVTYLA